MWDFETDPDYQADLDWADQFVRDEVEPLDFVLPLERNDLWHKLVPPLQDEVRKRGLWATHLGPELGGPGHGQVKLALLNEILGRATFAPLVFGCQAPDTGNAEILAHYGSEEHRSRWLQPLLDGTIYSSFSMTEPQAGSDPKEFTCSAVLQGDEWVINGEKWFSSFARNSDILIVMVVTEPEASPYQRHSMLIVPTDTPGVTFLRDVGSFGGERGPGVHAYIRYDNVRVPAENLLGGRGQAFAVSQTRLGGGRVHHAMRTVGMARQALDLMLERAVSRRTQGELLADKQLVQAMVADSWIDLEQYRLLVLRTAWRIDRYQDYKRVRHDIAAVKVALPDVLNRIASRALQIHGSLGTTDEMPLMEMVARAYQLGLADGPTEIHKLTVGRILLRQATPAPGLFPTRHIPALREAALKKYADVLSSTAG
ncbi:acyl-CoA dehydrogenase family protein [Nocardia pseudovaccinii]|uniref:acyl-CoA dehydrogenase family protein n=1 Tax=Nocardia pseudovaccinii TaxID=189540 RepID=UPI0007A4D053|nr:acyl-CoA dehydrogenase family protein [Nocardia pseudovaccinii]